MEKLTTSFAEELISGNTFSRRVFVQGLGFVSIGLLMGTFGGCEKIIEDIKNRPIRRRLRTGSAEVDADIAAMIGTRMMRPSVMIFGILNSVASRLPA